MFSEENCKADGMGPRIYYDLADIDGFFFTWC